MIFVLTAAAISASGNISSTRCVIMLPPYCNSIAPDIVRLQPACKNFSPASTPCLLDSALPPPWYCPAAVCPQRIFSEQQASLVWQDNVFVWQEKAAVEQHEIFAKQQPSFAWQQRVIAKQNPSAAGQENVVARQKPFAAWQQTVSSSVSAGAGRPQPPLAQGKTT